MALGGLLLGVKEERNLPNSVKRKKVNRTAELHFKTRYLRKDRSDEKKRRETYGVTG
jgi:hypothetical protein